MRTKWDIESVKLFIKNNSDSILLSEKYKNQKEKLKLKCKCGEIFYVTFDNFLRKSHRQCKNCGYKNGAKLNALSNEQFLNRLLKIITDDYLVVECNYKNQKSKIVLKHKVCGHRFSKTALKLSQGQYVCPMCKGNKKKTFEELQLEIQNISSELKLVGFKNSDNLEILHIPCGKIVKRTLYEVRKHKGIFCPLCKSSFGVREIRKYLSNNNIEFKEEYRFENCKFKKELPFDFYLPKYNICIEFDGEHHERPLTHWGGDKGFEMVKIRDNIKNKFCESKSIKLIRISYSQRLDINNILKENIF